MSGPRLAPVVVLLAAPALIGAACPRRPDDCEHDSIERCNWEQAVGKAEAGEGSGSGGEDSAGEGTDEGEVSSEERDELDETMLAMIEIMGGGLEWSLVDARGRELCRVRDENGALVPAPVELGAKAEGEAGSSEGDAGKANKADASKAGAELWRCPLDWLEINGQSLVLEASDGVISLSAVGLDRALGETVADFARARFDERCASAFEIYEGATLDVFHRCPLPEGPYLVVARFPEDPDEPETTRWQVSIAVVDAG